MRTSSINESPIANRLNYLDSAAGVCIIWVIFLCHTAETCGWKNPVEHWLLNAFSFAMSWFFFKAGMMFREKPFRELLRSSAKRLLVPFVIWSVIGWIVNLMGKIMTSDFSIIDHLAYTLKTFISMGAVSGNTALWFLLTLFLVRLAYNRLHAISIAPLPIAVASLALAYTIYHFGFSLSYFPGNFCNGLFFYTAGVMMKEKQFHNSLIALSVVVVLVQLLVFHPGYMNFFTNNIVDSNSYLLMELYCLAAIVLMNNIFRSFIPKKMPLLTHVGRMSMVYYVEHYIALNAFCQIMDKFNLLENSVQRFLITSCVIIASMIICEKIFMNDKLKFMVGV